MSIYHLSVKNISRGKGRSATAAAAYRSGSKIKDNRTGETHNYLRKQGVDYSIIIAPRSTPEWMEVRQVLWNEVEKVEKRKDARLAKEIEVAIPIELERERAISLVEEFVKEQCVERGMIADLNFHDLDSHNPHCHIMLTTRHIDGEEFGLKNRDWNNKQLVTDWRSSWERMANQALKEIGSQERIDCKSYLAQGIDRIPQIHLGANVSAMIKKGIATDRGDIYNSIQTTNQELKLISDEIEEIDREIERLTASDEVIVEEEISDPLVKETASIQELTPQQIHQNLIDTIGQYRDDLRVRNLLSSKSFKIEVIEVNDVTYVTLNEELNVNQMQFSMPVYESEYIDGEWREYCKQKDRVILTDEEKLDLIKDIELTLENEPEIKPEQDIRSRAKSRAKDNQLEL